MPWRSSTAHWWVWTLVHTSTHGVDLLRAARGSRAWLDSTESLFDQSVEVSTKVDTYQSKTSF
ncbi:hypothetical protein, partial [Stenotrophomonas maltophilia group sp. Smal35]|uniref:hypothetical protein n=1 Tax=Stenotrophomonas maltophilia group sp. Smal35 TaxID=3377163 RepID=UPI0025544A83